MSGEIKMFESDSNRGRQARGNHFSTGDQGKKSKFCHVTCDTLIFRPPLEIALIVNAV